MPAKKKPSLAILPVDQVQSRILMIRAQAASFLMPTSHASTASPLNASTKPSNVTLGPIPR